MLELSSNTIKVLGICGRLTRELEAYFDEIEGRRSQKPGGTEYDIFRHLTLTFTPEATIYDVNQQLILLRDLRSFLPLKIKVKRVFIKAEESLKGAEHIAIEFELDQTKELVEFVKNRVGESAVATWYIKVIWFVPKQHQVAVIEKLSGLKEIQFSDFYLVSNKQDDSNTIFRTSDFVR